MPRIAVAGESDEIQARYVITIRKDGALSVEGPIENKEYTLAVLDNAKDAVRNHHATRSLVVPGKNVTL